MSVRFVIKYGTIDNEDYNNDGKIDDKDIIVVKYIDSKEVSRKLLDQETQQKINNEIKNDNKENLTRVVYVNGPHKDNDNPPPVVIKQDVVKNDDGTF